MYSIFTVLYMLIFKNGCCISENRKEIKVKDLIIRKMSTRWGSCTPAGTITLNLNLIKAPRRCIEYVIIHELCHLVYHKHDARFYKLLHSLMPNWEKWKERLEVTLA